MSCFTGETSVSGIELETCFQSFGHHTKALALFFWTYSCRWVPKTPGARKTLKKNSLVLAGICTRAAWLAVWHSPHCATALLLIYEVFERFFCTFVYLRDECSNKEITCYLNFIVAVSINNVYKTTIFYRINIITTKVQEQFRNEEKWIKSRWFLGPLITNLNWKARN